jgi:hypothetical protein
MSRPDRLVRGPGFAVFTRHPPFAAELLAEALANDKGLEHVVCVPHETSLPALIEALRRVVEGAGRVFDLIPFEVYGAPETIHRVGQIDPVRLAIVVCDLRRMVSNRLDTRLHYLYTRHRARKKVVVDLVPYESMPWRVYFPFGVFNRHLLAFNHSYAIEQDYDKFLDGYTKVNPCEAALVAQKTAPAAFVDEAAFFQRRPAFVELQASAADHAAYQARRDELFRTAKSITTVKAQLGKWIQERYPSRTISADLKRVYAPDLGPITATDLPFDRWIVREIEALMDHTDALYAGYMRYQQEAGEC